RAGGFPAGWGEWNDRFRDSVRRFWRGDAGFLGELATRLAGSADVFGGKMGPTSSINFLSAHDGFTLADLVSYSRKHNEPNGEGNRDGTDANFSWNNGVEGPSADPNVAAARARDQRNLLATLLVSHGTPMLAIGSELGHSQGGNNNAYAQDNATSWLDWAQADATLLEFTQALIDLRRRHPALRHDRFLTGRPADPDGLPDVEWRGTDGRLLAAEDWQRPAAATLVATFSARDAGAADLDRVTILFHRGSEAVDVVLPEPRSSRRWELLVDSTSGPHKARPIGTDRLMVAARSVVILAEAEGQGAPPSRRGVAPDLLAQLASAAGIAGQWWDLTGSLHTVPDETSRMLIEGMGLAAGSNAQARESLLRLSEARDGRAVPHALVVRENQPVEIRLAVPARPLSLRLEREDGSVERFFYVEGNLRPIQISSADGRTREARVAIVPPQPVGRHRLRLEDHADLVCELTVAPARCHLPPAMAEGGRFFGIAAHLYALRRHGDQGIGDFTTLGRLGELAAAEGAATIGLNPLHALFPTDRAQASPYHPSDRRFLDPIYIDIAALNDLPQPPDPKSFGNEAAALTAGPMVDYRRVWALKSAALQRSFAAFDALLLHRAPEHVLAQAFRAFVERQGPALQRFACFETLAELRPGEPWASWPAGLREASSPEVEAFAQAHQERLRFHSFLQWLGDRQLATVAARAATSGLRLGLYRDLAVGAAPEGAEAWAEAAHLIGTASIGAPPDPFSTEGQIWH
ncbi:MAG: 4-alpha-glucanotransferase, partial [Methylobacteriaceae bacterium]|nr:4-alpha-glucanotransferase [Methylobacteriaceae bacterium]